MDEKLTPLSVGPWLLYSDRSFMNEQLLISQFLWEIKSVNVEGGWKLKFIFCFMETAHTPLYLDKWSLIQYKILDVPTSFMWIITLVPKAFKQGNFVKFWGYVGTNTETLRVDFCNFVQNFLLNNVSKVGSTFQNSLLIFWTCNEVTWKIIWDSMQCGICSMISLATLILYLQ